MSPWILVQAVLALAGLVFPIQAVAAQEQPADKEKALSELRKVTELQDKAFRLTNEMRYVDAEKIWTKIIELNNTNAAAYSNRGNCRTSQGQFEEAVSDFEMAIKLAPDEPDPYLGKGVALEGEKRFKEALECYETSNAKSISRYGAEDPVTYNNRGNAHAGLGEWDKAVEFYHKAAEMNKNYVFARANEALALYQLGSYEKSTSMMRFLARKYPGFADMHAALAAAYWKDGSIRASESEWASAMQLDTRYGDINWIRDNRRWPPLLVTDIEQFLSLKSSRVR
uniref:UDP-N-acetylglucosamine--peptide N-acetylglucosaminyltransferase SPINDLY n=1 Tax=Rhodosorus marinus TaxID=101924 RepID=A0A7S3A2U7_9RHOD|mmetsp:Transcript_42846/g.167437  ORF Transcript_42846/g.167437 Transcript_42846/m.167437 type:complete len:283 (+) Transcript_42846:470-1318(+)